MKKIVLLMVMLGILLSGCIEGPTEEELNEEIFADETDYSNPAFEYSTADCSSYEVSEVRNECYYGKAMDSESDYCKYINNEQDKSSCYYDLALFVWNVEYCENVITPEEYSDIPGFSRDFCIVMYVKDSLDIQACNRVNNSEMKKNCLKYGN